MKNRIAVFAVFVMLTVLVTGCQMVRKETKNDNFAQIDLQTGKTEEKNMGVSDLSRGDLQAMFEEVNNETVLDFYYADYNKDNAHEAFVLTENKLWYISPASCDIILEDLQEVDVSASDVLSFSTKEYLLLQFSKGSKNTRVFSIDNENRVMEAAISNKGIFRVDREGTMTLKVRTSVDEKAEDGVTYYLHYQIDGGFREYGGIPISEEQFLEYEGAEEILNDIHQRFENKEAAISFLYRSNSIININISVSDDGEKSSYNMTVKYGNTGVIPVKKRLSKGKVETAYMIEIATFPTIFKHPVKTIAE